MTSVALLLLRFLFHIFFSLASHQKMFAAIVFVVEVFVSSTLVVTVQGTLPECAPCKWKLVPVDNCKLYNLSSWHSNWHFHHYYYELFHACTRKRFSVSFIDNGFRDYSDLWCLSVALNFCTAISSCVASASQGSIPTKNHRPGCVLSLKTLEKPGKPKCLFPGLEKPWRILSQDPGKALKIKVLIVN